MNKQLEIQKYLTTVDQASLKEISENVPFGYYHNGMKHLGAIMSRMVKNGKVKRIRKGIYQIYLNNNAASCNDGIAVNKLQISMFEERKK